MSFYTASRFSERRFAPSLSSFNRKGAEMSIRFGKCMRLHCYRDTENGVCPVHGAEKPLENPWDFKRMFNIRRQDEGWERRERMNTPCPSHKSLDCEECDKLFALMLNCVQEAEEKKQRKEKEEKARLRSESENNRRRERRCTMCGERLGILYWLARRERHIRCVQFSP